MTQKTIWAVSSGSYSDYGVHAICSSKRIAEEVAERLGAEVEEFPYVTNASQTWSKLTYYVYINAKGEVVRRFDARSGGLGEQPPASPEYAWTYGPYGQSDGSVAYGCSDRGFEVALKAARDKLAQSNAEKAGV